MRIEVKEIKIFEFDELSKEIQEKLLKKEMQNQLELYCQDCLKEDMEEKAKELLQENFGDKATLKDVYYDLSYCQGSGAMIEFDLIYYNKHLAIIHDDNLYCHENTFKIIEEYNEELTEKQYNQLEKKIYTINVMLKKIGYKLIENEYFFKENALEDLKTNEYLENGEIY